MKTKTSATVYFAKTLVVIWIKFLSSTAQAVEEQKGLLKKLKFHACKRYIHQNDNLDSFSWQNSFYTSRFDL